MKVLLVDDEDLARERMSRLLQAMPELAVVGEAANGREALERIHQLQPDVVFLDIEMPVLNGLEVAACLQGAGPAIIFVTAFDQYAIDAFNAQALDYLVKPVAMERLKQTVHRLKKQLAPPPVDRLQNMLHSLDSNGIHKLAVRSGTRFIVIKSSDISCITAEDHYAEITHGSRKTLTDDSLDKLESRLDPVNFVRIHRQAIINLDFLQELIRQGDRKYLARMHDETELPVSRENLPKLKARLGLNS